MKVYNEDKTQVLEEYDLTKGYLIDDTLEIEHEATAGVEEVSYMEVIKEYPNGGKDVKKVIETPFKAATEAYTESLPIKVYVPYTQAQLNEQEITKLKADLTATDYKAIKYAEGLISVEDYAPIKAARQALRDKINVLEG